MNLFHGLSNSFGGELKQVNSHYLSTHKGGSGIGLDSITATAKLYGGSADFYHEGKIFYSNVMIKNRE